MTWIRWQTFFEWTALALSLPSVACADFTTPSETASSVLSETSRADFEFSPVYLPNGFEPSPLPEGDQASASVRSEIPHEENNCVIPAAASSVSSSRFVAEYDQGFVVRPINKERNPFELKIRGWGQMRYHLIDQEVGTRTDQAGTTFPVRDRNLFDVERARLIFSGFALDPRLTYFVNLDGDTDGADTVDFFDYWWGWQATDSLGFQLGKRKVPGSRQWILSARYTRMVDRPMACDFFRPDRTVGIFANGKIGDNLFIEGMVGNGYRTANMIESEQDNKMAVALNSYWDPFGNFGDMLVDYEEQDQTRMRIGHSFVYASQADVGNGILLAETDYIRLADGTRLVTPNALFVGQTVTGFDTFFYGVDLGWKRNGWSFDSEVFFRWLGDFRTDLGPTNTSVFQKGFYAEGGKFLIPQKVDLNFRYSQVSDYSAAASEYALASNWFPLKNSLMKLTLEAAVLDGAPLNNTGSDILVGDDGILYRSQFQVEF